MLDILCNDCDRPETAPAPEENHWSAYVYTESSSPLTDLLVHFLSIQACMI